MFLERRLLHPMFIGLRGRDEIWPAALETVPIVFFLIEIEIAIAA